MAEAIDRISERDMSEGLWILAFEEIDFEL